MLFFKINGIVLLSQNLLLNKCNKLEQQCLRCAVRRCSSINFELRHFVCVLWLMYLKQVVVHFNSEDLLLFTIIDVLLSM